MFNINEPIAIKYFKRTIFLDNIPQIDKEIEIWKSLKQCEIYVKIIFQNLA